jgi:hypothetical protein
MKEYKEWLFLTGLWQYTVSSLDNAGHYIHKMRPRSSLMLSLFSASAPVVGNWEEGKSMGKNLQTQLQILVNITTIVSKHENR